MAQRYVTIEEYEELSHEVLELRDQLAQALAAIKVMEGKWKEWEESGDKEEDGSGSEEEEDDSGSEEEEEDGGSEEEEEDDWTWNCCNDDKELASNNLCPDCGRWMCNCGSTHREGTKACRKCKCTNPMFA